MSGIDVFSKSRFEVALGAAVRKIVDGGNEARLGSLGVVQGEYTYGVTVQGTNKRIVVRSSVKSGQVSAGKGEDSIRMWLSYYYKSQWVAFKGETRTHRTPGWEERMAEKLAGLFKLALTDSKGRSTPKADDKLAALGLDVSTQADAPKDEPPEPETPKCPKCGGVMVLRTARRGPNAGNQFYGCKSYPRCKGTVDYGTKAESKPEPVEAKEFTPSAYQSAVKDYLLNETGNAVVIAVPGSGKTTTLVWLLGFTDKDLDIAFLAFNRHIAKELARRAPSHVHVSTLHSLGFGNIRDQLGRVKVEPNKVRNIVRDIAEGMTSRTDYELVRMNESAIIRLVSLCKATLSQPTAESLEYLCDRYGVETNGAKDLVFSITRKAFARSASQTHLIDYDDMIHFCATGKVSCQRFDLLFVDECQDLNKAQIEMVLRSMKESGRMIAVGDPKQSIYGFRASDTEAVPNLVKATNATTLPLSITYRCPKSHVEFIKHLTPDIEAAEWAEEGILEHGYPMRKMLVNARDGDLVLCRCNAPLIRPAFSLIRQGRKAVILGRDIGKGLVVLLRKVEKKHQVHQLGDILFYLTEYAARELGKLYAQKKINRAQILEDKVNTISALADGCDTMRELEGKIAQVFSDDAQGVTFSSVHKAKGAEAERVYILHPELMPHPKCKSAWEMEQEEHIQVVAYTRSKSEMYIVS